MVRAAIQNVRLKERTLLTGETKAKACLRQWRTTRQVNAGRKGLGDVYGDSKNTAEQ